MKIIEFIYSYLGHERIAEMLVESGANITIVSTKYDTALRLATFKGNLDIPKLIKWKYEMSITFHLGHEKIVELLIAKGADVDAVDAHQNTVLMMAALKGNIEV